MSPPTTTLKPSPPDGRLRARDRMLSLRPIDNHTIRLLASHHELSLRDTVHLVLTTYLSTTGIDLGKIFEDSKSTTGIDL